MPTHANDAEDLQVDGHTVRITHPEKLYFSRGVLLSKLDIAQYFVQIAEGALQGITGRPIVLKRFVDGAEKEPFYQKRAPKDLPEYLRTVTLRFPSGRTAEELVVDNAAGLLWMVNLGCMELHPHAVRASDLDHPDEVRVDLDPVPGVGWDDVRRVALETRAALEELGLTPYVKTSGSRGMHLYVRIQQQWDFQQVRRAALALAREVERRVPKLATSKWWKEERHGVFLDYNQNAKDRTTASAYSVRPLPDARVSAPLRWDEVDACDPADFTVLTMPARLQHVGNPHDSMEKQAFSLEPLLALADRDEREGLADAPWPPHYRKMEGEASRVAPSRAKKAAKSTSGRRVPSAPLLIVAEAEEKQAAMDGLERWKTRHPEAAALLAPEDVLVDRMRGRSQIWYRIRVNLRHVPENQHPAQETPDPNDAPPH